MDIYNRLFHGQIVTQFENLLYSGSIFFVGKGEKGRRGKSPVGPFATLEAGGVPEMSWRDIGGLARDSFLPLSFLCRSCNNGP